MKKNQAEKMPVSRIPIRGFMYKCIPKNQRGRILQMEGVTEPGFFIGVCLSPQNSHSWGVRSLRDIFLWIYIYSYDIYFWDTHK